MKIIVDAMGGDNAPKAIVDGAVLALNEDNKLKVVLVGREREITPILEGQKYDKARLEIIDAEDVISNDDTPTLAIRHKLNSSLIKGFDALMSDEEAGGFLSAGSTGAVLVGAFTKVGRIKGVSRPALAPVLPTLDGKGVILCDCGANVDCKAENLLHFAIMASVYAKNVLGAEKPRVGLLNNGAEAKKGNALAKEAYGLLSASDKINFVGNCEARDILSGDYDVVVADGFDGNIALKSAEGAATMMLKLIKNGVYSSGLKGKIGALLLKPVFSSVKKKMDYNSNGGACFLGVGKVVVKAHGASKPQSIKAAILQTSELSESDIPGKIAAELEECGM